MVYNTDVLNNFHGLTGLEYCLLSYLFGCIGLLALDNNDCDDVVVSRLRSFIRGLCEELHVDVYL